MARLNQDQLNRLRTALQRKGIVYQELEDELLDHVASEVEAEKAQGESFYHATKKAFIRFGPNELERIQRAFKRSLTKDAWQLAWTQYQTYWATWKVLLNIVVIVGLLLLNQWQIVALGNVWGLTWGLLFMTSIGAYFWFRQSINTRSVWDAGHQLFIGNYYLNLLMLLISTQPFFAAEQTILPIFLYLTLFSHLIFLESLNALKNKGLWVKPLLN